MRAALGWLLMFALVAPVASLAQSRVAGFGESLDQAASAFANGNFDGAIESATRALELSPDNFDALLLMGRALVMSDRAEDGMPYLDRALLQQPDHPVALRAKSVALFDMDDREQASAVLEHALKVAPDDSELYYNRACQAYEGQDTVSAEVVAAVLSDFGRATELDPRNADAWANMAGVKWTYQHDARAALPDINRAIALDENAVNLSLRAALLQELGSRTEALADVRRALELGGDEEMMDYLRQQLEELDSKARGGS